MTSLVSKGLILCSSILLGLTPPCCYGIPSLGFISLLTAGDTSSVSHTQYWIPALGLKDEHRTRINVGTFLDDALVDASQKLISKCSNDIGGLQSANLSQTKFVRVTKSDSIQIHNTGNLHWVTTTSIGKPRSCQARVCDSLAPSTISSSLATQIAQIYGTGNQGKLVVEISPVQQQEKGVDCGLFAIAFATDLAFGVNPAAASYDQRAMRKHFLQCLVSQKMEPFPCTITQAS